MRLPWKRKTKDEVLDERLEAAQKVLAESEQSLAQVEELSHQSAEIAARLRKELRANHFAPALREAIARSVR